MHSIGTYRKMGYMVLGLATYLSNAQFASGLNALVQIPVSFLKPS